MGQESQITRFTGWKEIGAYLNKSPRTVQRWEKVLGLPIRRIRTATGQIIFADRQEIDSWLSRQSQADLAPELQDQVPGLPLDTGQRRRTLTMALAGAAAIAVGAMLIRGPFGEWRDRMLTWRSSSRSAGVTAPDSDGVVMVTRNRVLYVGGTNSQIQQRIELPGDAPYEVLGPGQSSRDGRTLALGTAGPSGVVLFDIEARAFRPWCSLPNRNVTRALLSFDGRRVFAVNKAGQVDQLEASDCTPLQGLSVSGQSWDAVMRRQGDAVYVPSQDPGTITLVDLRTHRPLTTISTAPGAHDLVLTPDESIGLVTNFGADSVSCFRTGDNVVVRSAHVGKQPDRLVVAPSGSVLYVGNRESRSVSVLDPKTCAVVRTIEDVVPGSRPGAVGTSADGARLYVAGFDQPVVVVYETSTFTRVAIISTQTRVETFGIWTRRH